MKPTPAFKLYRNNDPDTSREAAESVDTRTQKLAVLRLLAEYGPMTASEVESLSPGTFRAHGAWRRICDCVKLDKTARDTGETRPGPSGRAQKVVTITGRGLAELGKPDPGDQW